MGEYILAHTLYLLNCNNQCDELKYFDGNRCKNIKRDYSVHVSAHPCVCFQHLNKNSPGSHTTYIHLHILSEDAYDIIILSYLAKFVIYVQKSAMYQIILYEDIQLFTGLSAFVQAIPRVKYSFLYYEP